MNSLRLRSTLGYSIRPWGMYYCSTRHRKQTCRLLSSVKADAMNNNTGWCKNRTIHTNFLGLKI